MVVSAQMEKIQSATNAALDFSAVWANFRFLMDKVANIEYLHGCNKHAVRGDYKMSQSRDFEHQPSSRITRRRLLQAGGIGALTMGLPGTVAASVDANRGLRGQAAEKSCIFILLCGGPSHLDTWDLKPGAPDDIRGPYRPVATRVPGMRISELHRPMPSLTQHF